MIKLKNKKAEGTLLGEHVIEIIIAAFVVLFLVGFGYMLYSMTQGGLLKSNSEKAAASLGQIKQAVDKLKVNGDSQEVLILYPTNWAIFFFSGSSDNENRKGTVPAGCGDKLGCICICDDIDLGPCLGSSVAKCYTEDRYIRGSINVLGLGYDNIPIKNPPVQLKISLNNNEITIEKV